MYNVNCLHLHLQCKFYISICKLCISVFEFLLSCALKTPVLTTLFVCAHISYDPAFDYSFLTLANLHHIIFAKNTQNCRRMSTSCPRTTIHISSSQSLVTPLWTPAFVQSKRQVVKQFSIIRNKQDKFLSTSCLNPGYEFKQNGKKYGFLSQQKIFVWLSIQLLAIIWFF